MRILILIVILTGIAFTSRAQWVCGTPQQEQHRREEHPYVESIEDFEKWMQEQQQPGGDMLYVQERAYVIPVVFHVIHNGEPAGKGANVSDEHLYASLKQLNDDFQRKNSDTVDTSVAFRHLAGKMNIQFILAKQDPNGVPTRGIVRVRGAKKKWDYLNEEEFKTISYWPSQDYLNVWIADFQENDVTKEGVLIGYAQFPESDLIKGLPGSSSNEKTDGVTLLPGTIKNDSLYKHILTHEVGHFLGLRHVWGSEGCNYDGDYVSDTPLQESATSGCPDFPVIQCSNSIMFHNYMDYSKCTNLFTQGQVGRMKIILNNSPRRKSLLTSKGGITPIFMENDIKLSVVLSPKKRACGTAVIPRIAAANWGKRLLSSARIKISVNGETEQVKVFTFSSALKQFEYDTLSFNPLNLSALPQGEHTLSFEALQVNEADDEQPENSILSLTTSVPKDAKLPYEVYACRDFKDTNIMFHLDNPENVKVDVYNLLGQLVSENTLQQAWREEYIINTGVKQPGVYLLRVYLKSGSKTTRIFINP